MVPVGFEFSDTLCELFIVVAVSLVSFSSFAVAAEVVNVVVVWLTSEVSAVSETFPQADKITAQSIDMTITFLILSRSFDKQYITFFLVNPDFLPKFYLCDNLHSLPLYYIDISGSGSSESSPLISSSGEFSTSISVC